MGTADVETSHGPVSLRGDPNGFRPGAPLIFGINGLFATRDYLAGLPRLFPECNTLTALIPDGLRKPAVAAFAAAFDEALDRLAPKALVLRLGVSVGALIAFAMRRGDFTVAIDPPLIPEEAWTIAAGLPSWARGDFRPLLAGAGGAGVVLVAGGELGEPRAVERMPAISTLPQREWIVAHSPYPATFIPNAGHDLLTEAPNAVLGALRGGLAQLAQSQVPNPDEGVRVNG